MLINTLGDPLEIVVLTQKRGCVQYQEMLYGVVLLRHEHV